MPALAVLTVPILTVAIPTMPMLTVPMLTVPMLTVPMLTVPLLVTGAKELQGGRRHHLAQRGLRAGDRQREVDRRRRRDHLRAGARHQGPLSGLMNGVAGSATAPRCRLRGTALRIDFRECGHSRAALRLTRSSSWVGQIVTLIRVRLGSK
jgi:hypothetical protein